ncbi:MAG: type II secretion system F family protein [Sulfitobacter sp.]
MRVFEDIDPIYFLYIGAFLGLIMVIEGIRQSFLAGEPTKDGHANRMRRLKVKMAREESINLVRKAPKRTLLGQIPIYGNLPAKMTQAGMSQKPSTFLAVCGLGALSLFGISSILLGIKTAAFMAALTGMVIPMSIINIIRKRRVQKFAEQLPDALELMMRGLRVGHPLNVTIHNVAANMADPIAAEFGIVARQITYGDELVEAFFDLADRIDQEDMHYLAVSISIQHGTGGNLAGMLGTLSRVIRGRFAMRRRISAISSEGRITVWVLTSLPFLMYGVTSLTAPGYYSSVSDDPLYLPIAGAIGFLVTLNFIVMRRLVNFRI